MGKLEPFDHLFETFQPTSLADWQAKVKSDLKLEDIESLNWRDEDGLVHQAYYHAAQAGTEGQAPLHKEKAYWSILQTYRTEDWSPEELKAHLDLAFANGLECAVLISEEYSEAHWSLLDQSRKKNGQLKYQVKNGLSNAAITKKQGMLVDPIARMIMEKAVDHDQIEKLNQYFIKQINSFNMQRFLLVEGSIYGKMGASPVQELAYCLRHTTEYMDLLTEAGHRADAIFRSLTVNIGIGSAYFQQIAKFRALRIVLDRLQDHYQCKEKIRIWAESNPYYLDHENFNNNLIRLSAQAMSGVLGMVDRISLSNAGAKKSRKLFADRMLRNIQLMLKDESRFAKVEDLLSGAYYIEELSRNMVEESWALFMEMEQRGSLIQEIENGELFADINRMDEDRIREFQKGARVMVGVNKYRHDEAGKGETPDQSSHSISRKLINS